MSMPVFPDDGICITRDQAFNMLLGSIAMEELGLSHIINAEGEKLQYVLGTLPKASVSHATTKELLEVNQSITTLLENVAHNQFLLRGKLAQVLEAQEKWCPPPCPPPCPSPCPPCPPPCPPCPPPCPPCPPPCPSLRPQPWCLLCPCMETRVYHESREGPWCAGQRFVWRDATLCCTNSPAGETSVVAFCPSVKSVSLVSFHFELLSAEAGPVTAALSYTGCCAAPILKAGGYAAKAREPVCFCGSTVLTPPFGGAASSGIVFSLCGPQKVLVKKAALTLTTITERDR